MGTGLSHSQRSWIGLLKKGIIPIHTHTHTYKKTNSVALSPQENYTD
jgi:hypothetical protein